MKLTEDEVSSILWDDGVYDEVKGEETYSVVKKKIISNNQEKGSVDYEIVIKEMATGKFYKGYLGDSPWWKQSEANGKTEWKEVKKKKKTKIVYK